MLQYSPATHDRTAFRAWLFTAPFESGRRRSAQATRPITDPFRRRIYRHYFNRVVNEDASVCERIQTVAHQIDKVPMLGAREERVGWFEESIQELTSATTAADRGTETNGPR